MGVHGKSYKNVAIWLNFGEIPDRLMLMVEIVLAFKLG
jgi:hypothetical protein